MTSNNNCSGSNNNRHHPYDLNWCKRKRFSTANIVRLLCQREIGTRREGSNFMNGSREFYHSITVERQEDLVERPSFFSLRFTPDGNKLIGFGPSMQVIYVFAYRGVQFGADCPVHQLFFKIFTKPTVIQFWDTREQENPRPLERLQFGYLSKDCSFITPDSRYLIVSTTVPVLEIRSTFSGILRNNESLPPGSHLANTTFYSIDLKKEQVVDNHKFEFDEIHMQSGVYLFEWTLAILSVQHQTIHILGIDKSTGQFIQLRQIGPSMLDDDQLWDANSINFSSDRIFTGFRQSFLTYLFKEHANIGQVKKFLYEIEYYKCMKMQKIQLVGPEMILIRMDLHPQNNEFSQSGQHFLFVLLNWRYGKIAGVYDRSSEQLFAIYEHHNEFFKNGHLATNNFPNSMEHCGHVRAQHQFTKESLLASIPPADTRRRFLIKLPVPNNQHFTISPYFDPEMFSYDERSARFLEKNRFPLEKSLILFSRRTKRHHTKLKFTHQSIRVYQNCYARVFFHPIDPFAISINRGNGNQSEHLISFYMPRKCE